MRVYLDIFFLCDPLHHMILQLFVTNMILFKQNFSLSIALGTASVAYLAPEVFSFDNCDSYDLLLIIITQSLHLESLLPPSYIRRTPLPIF